jgi:hypothetical protein
MVSGPPQENDVTSVAGVPCSSRYRRSCRTCVWTPVFPSSRRMLAITSGSRAVSGDPWLFVLRSQPSPVTPMRAPALLPDTWTGVIRVRPSAVSDSETPGRAWSEPRTPVSRSAQLLRSRFPSTGATRGSRCVRGRLGPLYGPSWGDDPEAEQSASRRSRRRRLTGGRLASSADAGSLQGVRGFRNGEPRGVVLGALPALPRRLRAPGSRASKGTIQ